MAGRGSRFANAGYTVPKPLIDIFGKPMIQVVVENVRPICEHQFIFICSAEHIQKYNLEKLLDAIAPGCIIVQAEHITEGAACTVLLSEQYIDGENALMIANSDQYVNIDINYYLAMGGRSDGFIMTMTASDPKWSFIQYDGSGVVVQVKEKEVISSEATVGIYNFKHGKDFVRAAHNMIDKNIRVNHEFYVAPVYNELILEGKKITFYNIGSVGQEMYGLGTPDDLRKYCECVKLEKKY